MTKHELIKALEGYPDDEIILIDVSPLYDGEATWFGIANVDAGVPATIRIENEACMM